MDEKRKEISGDNNGKIGQQKNKDSRQTSALSNIAAVSTLNEESNHNSNDADDGLVTSPVVGLLGT